MVFSAWIEPHASGVVVHVYAYVSNDSWFLSWIKWRGMLYWIFFRLLIFIYSTHIFQVGSYIAIFIISIL